MSPSRRIRRSHNKSRGGCAECKRRHRKCDEERPKCGNCKRLRARCEWPADVAVPPNDGIQAGNRVVIEQRIEQTPFQDQVDLIGRPIKELQIDDLKLLHKYVLVTAASLDPGATELHSLWRGDVVELAFLHPFLLRGVLAMSALHLGFLDLERRPHYLTQASAHMNCGLQGYRRLLCESKAESVQPLFIFSTLVTIYNLGVATIDQSSDTVQVLLDSMTLIRGVGSVIGKHRDVLFSSPVGRLALNGHVTVNEETLASSVEAVALDNLLYLPGFLEQTEQETCKEAINELRRICFTLLEHGTEKSKLSMMLSWPTTTSSHFHDMLAERLAVPLIILAYYAAICWDGGQRWWLAGCMAGVVIAVGDLVPASLQSWLVWPLKRIHVDDKQHEPSQTQSKVRRDAGSRAGQKPAKPNVELLPPDAVRIINRIFASGRD